MTFSKDILECTIHGKIWKRYIRTINLKSAPAWNEEFELPNGSYSASDTQEYFENILKNMEKKLIIIIIIIIIMLW